MKPLLERFEKKCIPEPNTGCWLWFGAMNSDGYGNIGQYPKTLKAHQVSYSLFRGPIPEGAHVLHRCDVRWCVNPSHLYLGTHQDNMRDRTVRLRGTHGAKNYFAKLSEDQVLAIRNSSGTIRAVAKLFGISSTTVCWIRNGRTWKTV